MIYISLDCNFKGPFLLTKNGTNRKTELTENCNSRLFVANGNGNGKLAFPCCKLQNENESLFSLVSKRSMIIDCCFSNLAYLWFWKPCLESPIPAALSCQPCPGLLSWQFCPGSSVCPILPVQFCWACSAWHALPVLFCLSCPVCPILPVPFWISVLFLAVLFRGCPVLAVLSLLYLHTYIQYIQECERKPGTWKYECKKWRTAGALNRKGKSAKLQVQKRVRKHKCWEGSAWECERASRKTN